MALKQARLGFERYSVQFEITPAVAEKTGSEEREIRPAIKYAKAQGWFEASKLGHTKDWLSVTPAGILGRS